MGWTGVRGWAGAGRRAAGWLLALARDLAAPGRPPLGELPWPRPARAAWLADAALAVPVALAAAGLGAATGRAVAGAGVTGVLAAALGVAQAVPLLLALARPVAGFWLSMLAGMAVSETLRAGGAGPVWAPPSLLAHLGVLALVALVARPRVLVALWLLTLLAGTVLVQRMPGLDASSDLAAMTTLSAVVLLALGAARGRGEARRRLAEQVLARDAERARRALLEERARIARELHDVVAHHMSVIAIQAEAAPYRVPDAPAELAASFATIRANAVQGLGELRRVLDLLRAGGPEDGQAPQPDLASLDELLANGRSAGLKVRAAVVGERRTLPPGVELSAYRIVQEALSNAMRHAPGADVSVEVAYRPGGLALRVENGPPRGTPSPSRGPGHGLLGMRERAAMLGGELLAGPGPDGGYAVTALLPAGDGGGT